QVLGTIEVIRPDTQPEKPSEVIAQFANLNLLAVDGMPESAQVGDEMSVRWLWHLLEEIDADLDAKLIWLDEDKNIQAESSQVSLVTHLPTSTWQAGDIWRGVQRVY